MTPDDLVGLIVAATDRAELEQLWHEHRSIWQPWHTGLATMRLWATL